MSGAWQGKVITTPEFDRWFRSLDDSRRDKLLDVIEQLAAKGPFIEGKYSKRLDHNGKPFIELRVQTLRALYAFDRNRNAVLLYGGDKAGEWTDWYEPAFKHARHIFANHLASLPQRPGAAK